MARATSPFCVFQVASSWFLDRDFKRWSTTVREGGRRERRAAVVRAHCRLAVHYAKRLNDRNICIFAHCGTGEALRRALRRPESVVSSRRRLSVRAEQRPHVSKLLSRETLDSAISRASWRDVALGSFECLRSVARLQYNWRFDMKKIIGIQKSKRKKNYIFNICWTQFFSNKKNISLFFPLIHSICSYKCKRKRVLSHKSLW